MIYKIRDLLMRTKFYIGRSMTYVSLANTGMLIYLSLSSLKTLGYIHIDLGQYMIGIIIVTFALLIGWGWIETNYLKGYGAEAKFSYVNEPLHKEMNDKINLILNKLNNRK